MPKLPPRIFYNGDETSTNPDYFKYKTKCQPYISVEEIDRLINEACDDYNELVGSLYDLI